MHLSIDIPEGNTREQFLVLMHLAIAQIKKTTNAGNIENNKNMMKLAKSILRQVHEQ